MKFLAISDLHLDAVTAGRPRRAEVVEYLRDAHAAAVREDVDAVIFSGDAFDPGGPLEAYNSALLISALMAFTAQRRLIAIAGNHDVLDTSELFEGSPITTLTPLRVAAHYSEDVGLVNVFEYPCFEEIDDYGVLALPYVSRAHSARMPNWVEEAFGAAARFAALGGRIIVVAHLVIPGATLGSESIEMARGQDQVFPFEAVAVLKPALVINGHYHARQEVLGPSDVLIQIPGSPLRFTFGEVEDERKGILIAEVT